MPYREIIAICSDIHTKHIFTLCALNVEFFYVKRVAIYTADTRRTKPIRSSQHDP
jgi:uncharacterized membrane protein